MLYKCKTLRRLRCLQSLHRASRTRRHPPARQEWRQESPMRLLQRYSTVACLFHFIGALRSAPAEKVGDTRLVSKAALPRQRSDALLDLFHRSYPDRAIDDVDANRTTLLKANRTSQLDWQTQATGFADMPAQTRSMRYSIDGCLLK